MEDLKNKRIKEAGATSRVSLVDTILEKINVFLIRDWSLEERLPETEGEEKESFH